MALRRGFVAFVAGAVTAVGVVSAAPPPQPELPSAASIMVRGQKILAGAIRAAIPPRAPGQLPPLVVLVIDVTKNVVRRGETVRRTIAGLAQDRSFAREVRLAPLGKAPASAAKSPEAGDRDVRKLLAKETPAPNTFAALRASLASVREPAIAVYVCDWRFEDDQGVDALADDLAKRGIVFSTVGTEAAFERAWTDGTVDPSDNLRGMSGDYYPGIGRSPFGKPDAAAPWHGGESAYPAIPYRFHSFFWDTEFQLPSRLLDLRGLLPKDAKPGDPGAPPKPGDGAGMADPAADPEGGDDGPAEPEELGERLGEKPDLLDPDRIRKYPIPSAFGPYGLLRLAAATGGRYVLWSWNPRGRARVTYDYGRCNLFGPDLRSREQILAEVATDPLAKAMLDAWHALAVPGGLVEQTPPVDRDGKTPRTMDRVWTGGEFDFEWASYGEWKGFRRALTKVTATVAEASKGLHAAVDTAKEPPDDVGRRRLAEARLFSHTVDVIDFELHELDLATADVKPDLWRTTGKGKTPGVSSREFILGKGNPLAELGELSGLGRDAEALDRAAGERIRKARAEHLERYRGTPFAAQVDLADVNTFRITEWEMGNPISRGGVPSESGGGKGGHPATPPPGGSSGGGGPTTGK